MAFSTSPTTSVKLSRGTATSEKRIWGSSRGMSAATAWDWARAQTGTPLVAATAPPDAVRAAQQKLGTARAAAIVEETLAGLDIHRLEFGIVPVTLDGILHPRRLAYLVVQQTLQGQSCGSPNRAAGKRTNDG